mgnify:CR=1 FL=1
MEGGRDIFACRSVSDRIRPYLFPFGFLPPKLWDIKPRGNGKPWAMGPAVEDTDGRSVSDRTRPHFFFFGLCSTRSPYRGTGFRYRIRPCYVMGYKAKGKWEALGDGACRRRYGRPERERPHKTSLFLLWLMLHPIPLPGHRLPV